MVLPELSGPKISTMRPRGRPPTPSAISSPRLPVEITSTFIVSLEPSFIAEPLPKARSICASAASSAFWRSVLFEREEAMPESITFRFAAISLPSHR